MAMLAGLDGCVGTGRGSTPVLFLTRRYTSLLDQLVSGQLSPHNADCVTRCL